MDYESRTIGTTEFEPEQVKRLADGIDAASLSPMLASNLGLRLSDQVGDNDVAAAILTIASQSHPTDFWLQFSAAQTFAESESAETKHKAIGYYRAALASPLVPPRANPETCRDTLAIKREAYQYKPDARASELAFSNESGLGRSALLSRFDPPYKKCQTHETERTFTE